MAILRSNMTGFTGMPVTPQGRLTTNPFSDRSVFRSLRLQQLNQNNVVEKTIRLNKNQKEAIDRLYYKLKPLGRAFDDLLPFMGLWPPRKCGLQFGNLHDVVYMRCHEVSWLFRPEQIDLTGSRN